MKNSDMPAMPVTDEAGMPFNDVPSENCSIGLTKREHFAATMTYNPTDIARFTDEHSLCEFLGHSVDLSSKMGRAKAGVELEARIRVMKADALLAELERTR